MLKARAGAKALSTSSPMSVSMITFSGITLSATAGAGKDWPRQLSEDTRVAQPKMQDRIAGDLCIRDRLSSDGYRAGCRGWSGKGMSLSRGQSMESRTTRVVGSRKKAKGPSNKRGRDSQAAKAPELQSWLLVGGGAEISFEVKNE
jgi:hypothetical protein